MNIPKLSAEYVCAYKGSLIGKHFKSLAQLMPFLIYDIVPRKVVDAWTIIGELVVLIWHTEIDDLETYLSKLSSTIESFLNMTADNCQAPSRDSCKAFTSQDITKHIVTGGFWHDKATRKWVLARPSIHSYMEGNKLNQQVLAIPDISREVGKPPGTVKHLPLAKDEVMPSVPWHLTDAFHASNVSEFDFLEGKLFYSGVSVTAANGDEVRCNMFAAIRQCCEDQTMCVGRLKEVLTFTTDRSKAVVVKVELFEFLPTPHKLLRVPMLRPRLTNDGYHIQVIFCPTACLFFSIPWPNVLTSVPAGYSMRAQRTAQLSDCAMQELQERIEIS
ncbi:hypothetical protein V5O48_006331 [Marasmius crinis-equi]|uniref:Uncharacterized protein n=1 Tax=Marasmius crinis-equi TaxID=585013 RepID=A0ABR3FKF0_9AGAR